jgi:hypothetical protein
MVCSLLTLYRQFREKTLWRKQVVLGARVILKAVQALFQCGSKQ